MIAGGGAQPKARTMIVSVPVLNQDLSLADEPAIGRWLSLASWYVMKGEEPYFDGPVSRRVAVIDVDPTSGALRPGARFVDGRPLGETSYYEVEPGERDAWGVGEIARLDSDAFLQASVFGTVIQTVQMFERAPMLGRPVRWAFAGEQLLVVPRAGEMANAFYQRETASLQFFSVGGDEPGRQPIHTALSHDVVAHETAHAVLDGICPDLYDAISPQARALHETFADIVSLLSSLGDRHRLRMELDIEGRSLRSQTTFARLAEQLGREVGAEVGADALRDANNRRTLKSGDTSRDRHNRPNYVDGIAPHDLSMVMTGAFYGVFRRLAVAERTRFQVGIPKSWARLGLGPAALGAHLAAQRVAQSVIRALDHLPPGEATFADFGRAFLAADRLGHPRGEVVRGWLVNELMDRGVVARRRELTPPSSWPAVAGWDGAAIEADAGAARRFVQRNRQALGVAEGVPFAVQRYSTGRGQTVVRVTWTAQEPNAAASRIAPLRAVSTGTALVADTSSGRVLSLLKSDTTHPRQATDRDRVVRWLADEGLLLTPEEAVGPDGRRLVAPLVARSVRQTLTLTGGARMVHCLNFPTPEG
ncbi:MAG: hypothetical protein ACLGHZ_05275 [Actinomycetes bacterium]